MQGCKLLLACGITQNKLYPTVIDLVVPAIEIEKEYLQHRVTTNFVSTASPGSAPDQLLLSLNNHLYIGVILA